MPRQPRQYSPDIAYHVIARGNNRQVIFRDQSDYEQFLYYLGLLKSEVSFEVFHYCLMPNHIHLLARFPNQEAFVKAPQRLLLLYAKHMARQYKHVGHVFQDRFKSIPVKDDGYLLECGRYIERNPVNAKMALAPHEYRWSSYGFYAFGQRNDLVSQNPLFASLGQEDDTRRKQYRNFVLTERPYEQAVIKSILGRHAG